MNRYHQIDKRLQFDFFINIIRKRKRFSKWNKKEIEGDLEVIKEYYGYNESRALETLSILSPEQIDIIRKKVNKGGRK